VIRDTPPPCHPGRDWSIAFCNITPHSNHACLSVLDCFRFCLMLQSLNLFSGRPLVPYASCRHPSSILDSMPSQLGRATTTTIVAKRILSRVWEGVTDTGDAMGRWGIGTNGCGEVVWGREGKLTGWGAKGSRYREKGGELVRWNCSFVCILGAGLLREILARKGGGTAKGGDGWVCELGLDGAGRRCGMVLMRLVR